ncbi:hypothetical protein [Aromatoleum anaerobium]|uniref:Uncharacterized protein n=1 Tax=Aromatoleum anaerobium TaxID=182180 RepID=A0ABX1PLV3_9RHOO|nr:hypothetical protein [Aromatoleum anaerobium]MCK0505985.1 hypothetical protein [Aromatoleum anaerobium]
MFKTFVKLSAIASVAVASVAVAVPADTKVTVNAKSKQQIDSMCESVGKFGAKVFEEMVRQGNVSELISKAKQMDKGTGLLMLAAAEAAILHFASATKDHGLYASEYKLQKELAETAAYIRCHSMVAPKFN